MDCCGEERTTPYCPECGDQLIQNAMIGIKSFIQGKLNGAESVQLRNNKWAKEHPDRVEPFRIRKREAHQRKIDKYKYWIKELEQLKA